MPCVTHVTFTYNISKILDYKPKTHLLVERKCVFTTNIPWPLCYFLCSCKKKMTLWRFITNRLQSMRCCSEHQKTIAVILSTCYCASKGRFFFCLRACFANRQLASSDLCFGIRFRVWEKFARSSIEHIPLPIVICITLLTDFICGW